MQTRLQVAVVILPVLVKRQSAVVVADRLVSGLLLLAAVAAAVVVAGPMQALLERRDRVTPAGARMKLALGLAVVAVVPEA